MHAERKSLMRRLRWGRAVAAALFLGLSIGSAGAARVPDTVNVVGGCGGVAGADPTGARDSAPAFRACIASGREIFVPPGQYLFASTTPAPCCALEPQAVLVDKTADLRIIGRGATIILAPDVRQMVAFRLHRSTDIEIAGLTIRGSQDRSRYPRQVHIGIAATSVVGLVIRDVRFSGVLGSAIAGDWLVGATFADIRIAAANQCMDLAFLRHVVIRDVAGRGYYSDRDGATAGQKCISIINDPINQNQTPIAYTETDGVLVTGVYATNFAAGALVTSGRNIRFEHNIWERNPGNPPNAKGIGLLIDYWAGGKFTSEGFPPSDITVMRDSFIGNGAVVPGFGIMIDSRAVRAPDRIANITVADCVFDDNRPAGIGVFGKRASRDLRLIGNAYSGASQLVPVRQDRASLAVPGRDAP